MVGLFCVSSQHVRVVGCFFRGVLPQMFDEILDATLSEEKVSTTGVTQENLELPLPPSSLDSNQTKNNKMKSWVDPRSSIP